MAELVPQSVAKLVVFRAFLASDGKTPATGKTIAITISKNGATSFSNPAAGATNATEMASGFYKFTLGATDVDTLGPLAYRGAEAAINDVGDVFTVASAHNAGFDAMPNAAANSNGGLPVLSSSGTTLAYTVSTLTTYTGNTPQTGDCYPKVDTEVATLVTGVADIQARLPAALTTDGNIKADTLRLGGTLQTARDIGLSVLLSSGTGTGQVKLSSGYVAPNWGDVGNPTTTVGLTGTTISTGQVVASVSGAVGSVTGAVGSVTAVVSANVTEWLGTAVATPNVDGTPLVDVVLINGSAVALDPGSTPAEIAAAVWEVLVSTLTTSGSVGKLLADNIDATVSSRSSHTAAQVSTQVWTEPIPGSFGSGTAGFKLNGASSAGDPWTTALPGAYGAGTAGFILGTNLNATVGSRSSHAAADIWAVGTRTLTAFSFSVTVGTNSDKTGYSIGSGGITSASFAAGAINATALAANVVNVIWMGTALTESYAADGADFTPAQCLYEVRQFLTDFSISGTTYTVKKKDGSTTAATYTLDDATNPSGITRAS